MIIKIYGERNTGTNYLMRLLSKHLNVLEINGSAIRIASSQSSIDLKRVGEIGWKHRLVSKEFLQSRNIHKDDILIITLTKNPYSWSLSMHKRPYAPIYLRAGVRVRKKNGGSKKLYIQEYLARIASHFGRRVSLYLSRYPRWCFYKKLKFSDFIRTKWFSEFHEGQDEGFKNVIDLWNEKNKHYLELSKHYNVLLLTYEELLADPEMTIKKITNYLGYSLENFVNEHDAAKEKDIGVKNYAYYRDYYLEERWRKKLKPSDIQWISSQLDPEVMATFRYAFL